MILKFGEKMFEILLLPSGEVISIYRRNIDRLTDINMIKYKRFIIIDDEIKDVHGYVAKDENKYKIIYIDEI